MLTRRNPRHHHMHLLTAAWVGIVGGVYVGFTSTTITQPAPHTSDIRPNFQ